MIVTFNNGGINVKAMEPTPEPTSEPTPEPTSEPTQEPTGDFTRPVVEIKTNADVLKVDDEVIITIWMHMMMLV